MSIAITEDHRSLAETVSSFADKRDLRGAARALLEASDEPRPQFWNELAELGWLGLAVPEEYGGSGFGLPELVVVVEELGRADAPGPFVPTVIASAFLTAAADDSTKSSLLPGLADGTTTAGIALDGDVELQGSTVSGSIAAVLGGGLADVLLVPVGDDVAVISVGDGVTVETPPNLDPTRRTARVTLDNAPATVLPGARQTLRRPRPGHPVGRGRRRRRGLHRARAPSTPRSASSSAGRSPCTRRSSTTAPT